MAQKDPLGRLQRVDLRAYWASEATDFTPWLAQKENLSLLAETIGVDLEYEECEQRVGPFRADIVCNDSATSRKVLIENQLARTDHVHLGQLLTYAAGLEAVSIVWIAERFGPSKGPQVTHPLTMLHVSEWLANGAGRLALRFRMKVKLDAM